MAGKWNWGLHQQAKPGDPHSLPRYGLPLPPAAPREPYCCPFCRSTSEHPRDIRESYCARCHLFAIDVRSELEGYIYWQPEATTAPVVMPLRPGVLHDRIDMPVRLGVLVLSVLLADKAVGTPLLQEHIGNTAPMMSVPRMIVQYALLELRKVTQQNGR